jgi:cell pole-organizing protein PopZ
VRAALSELATPTRIDNIVAEEVRGVLAATVSTEVARASDEIRVRVETELLSRLDHFARTELRDRLTAHAEQIVWKVVPTLAEDLVKDEIKRLTAD